MAREKYIPTDDEVESVETHFLAGEKLKEVKESLDNLDMPARCFSEIRDRLFHRLRTDPKELAKLANGPLLNANAVVRYPGMARAMRSKAYQSSILDICDGRMNSAQHG